MNQEKRKKYVLTGSYHTLEIKSKETVPTQNKQISRCITTKINSEGTIATSKINSNKLVGDIFTFSEFKKILDIILKENGINEYRITRADMRLDNYNEEHYQAFAKLNKYLISAVALTYSIKNRYKTVELINENQLSIAVKNDYFELENYDRAAKSEITKNITELAKARFEERTISKKWRKLNGGDKFFVSDWNFQLLKEEFTTGWETRWNKAKENLKLVQDTYNEELVKKYYQTKNAYPVQFRTLTDFLIRYQESIFTSRQMINLLKRLGVENAENRAKYHKKKYGIEYFSQKDIDFAIREIKRASRIYFEN